MARDPRSSNDDSIPRDVAAARHSADVGDQAIARTVPLYREMQRMTVELAARFAQPDTTLYDLGCATGLTLLELDGRVDPSVRFVGIDNSPDRLEEAAARLRAHGMTRPHELRTGDLLGDVQLPDASVVVLLLTLELVRPLQRAALVRAIAGALAPGGCLILVERVTTADATINLAFNDFYRDMKQRNGAAETDDPHHRETLEHVLVPFHAQESRDLLLQAGFARCEAFFRWYNFVGLVALR